MTTENITTATESTEAASQKITLTYLLDGLERYNAGPFEEWAEDVWRNAVGRLEAARTRLRRMERLGVGADVLEAERVRLTGWGVQVAAAQLLCRANSDDLNLDYTDPAVLKYFALWLWATDGDLGEYSQLHHFTSGPLDWALYLDEELLALPGFGLR